MVRLLKVVVFLIVALVVVFLSIANRHSITVSLDPFSRAVPEFSFSAPLFLVLFGAIALGVIVGGIAAWGAQGHKRRELRHARRQIRDLKSDAEKAGKERPISRSGLPSVDKAA